MSKQKCKDIPEHLRTCLMCGDDAVPNTGGLWERCCPVNGREEILTQKHIKLKAVNRQLAEKLMEEIQRQLKEQPNETD